MRRRITLAVAAALALAAPGSPAASAAAPPPGSLLERFALNQFQNCAVICPFAAQGAVTVPLGAASAPIAFLRSAADTGNPLAALGAAALSVTAPADAAMTGIIGNDLNQVVPRFQNGVLIAMVDLLRIADGSGSVTALRTDLLAALREPLPPAGPVPPPLTAPPPFGIMPTPVGPVQVAAVRATNIFFAAAFFVPELSLLGATQTANAAASTLARTGDPVAAAGAGLQSAGAVASENVRILSGAFDGADITGSAATNPRAEAAAPATRDRLTTGSAPPDPVVPEPPRADRTGPEPIGSAPSPTATGAVEGSPPGDGERGAASASGTVTAPSTGADAASEAPGPRDE
ncbi:hypothetical protein AXK56_07425 [Tsukamurella pulmonis]|uniref:Uncharacterized protein n=1 Tax=Tsukamurella pulmonis TaxID=47312 RepID=A0A1H1CDH0_9ACTN|nr:hypothetical protein [Tsukamurella pulmonis]KXO89971.1 hypothetical protein AXK56_07425 [Tsukamurella pulmonis]SDQ61706.1 hypothetical protein SAMN04489765_1130 [Tsukamurella pulmonis]SUP23908.1 Uncharacterised protein [Tsukamurella pulmonis]